MSERIREKVKAEMEKRGLTRYRIAKDAGISSAQLSVYLNRGGKDDINDKLLDILNLKITAKKGE